MFLNQTELTHLCQEIAHQTLGKFLKQIRLYEQGGIGFDFGKGTFVILYALPGCSFIYLTENPPPKRPNSAWIMLLRKHLKGKKLTQISQVPGDRIVCFDFGDTRVQWDVFGRRNRLYLLQGDTLLGQNRPGLAPTSAHEWSPVEPREGLTHSEKQEQALLFALDAKRFSRALNRLGQELAKTNTRIEQAERQVEQALEDTSQRWADLLQGAYGTLEKGATQAQVIDFYDPAQKALNIPLDPQLGLAQNIQKYYDKAKKCERTLDYWETHLPPLENAFERLHTLKSQMTQVFHHWSSSSQSTALKSQLETGLSPWMSAVSPPTSAKTTSPPSKIRPFFSAENYPIWVGKGAKENHELTFKHAKGNDFWFHLKNRPGPHVVVRLPKGIPLPQETLLDAATLACHFAKSTGDEVMYTQVKHLSPVKGAPGKAYVSQYKSVHLVLEKPRLERLLQKNKEEI